MEYFNQLLSGAAAGVLQSRAVQWPLNKVRETVYPFYYNHNAWEASLILSDQNVWLGSLASACDRSALKARNITRIISAVYDINPIFPDDPELIYLKIPVLDKPSEQIATHFEKAIDFIDESIQHGHGVLVHCVYGISRSSTLMCAYLMRKHNMSVKIAIEYIKASRPQVNPNAGFLLQLCSYSSPFVRVPGRKIGSLGSSPIDEFSAVPRNIGSLGSSPADDIGIGMIPLFPDDEIDEDQEDYNNHN